MTEMDALPRDEAAERIVLGSAMLSAVAAELVIERMNAGQFYQPAHGAIFEAIKALYTAGKPTEPGIVLAYLIERGTALDVGGGPYLHTLVASVATPMTVTSYIEIVRDREIRRRLVAAGSRIHQRAMATSGLSATELAEECAAEVTSIRDYEFGDDVSTPTVAEFLDHQGAEYDWLIPDLLERRDRLVITSSSARSGVGKSTLCRQIAVMSAVGLHPFKGTDLAPLKVLMVDLENPAQMIRRKIRPLWAQARLLDCPVDPTRLWIESRPDGLDLMADQDVSWLLRRVNLINPDLVIIGPLYKLCPRAMNTDDEASPVIAALNRVRAHGAALIVEAHGGHTNPAPRGSSAWRNWPEFGYSLRVVVGDSAPKEHTVDFVEWRGDRDERAWPERLQAGGTWPWSSVDTWTPHDMIREGEGSDGRRW